MGRVLVTGGRFSVFEPLMGEAAWSAGEGEDVKEFLEMEKILRERRGPSSVDRVKLRDAFEKAGLRPFESLVVYFSLTSEGRSEEEILRGYLYDLPGEFSAFSVLKCASLTEKDIMGRVLAFAQAASAGKVKGEMPCIFIRGVK
jgi:hypothetical protein